MVNVVGNSFRNYNNHYLELNQQLARENGELKQQLGHAITEISHQKEDLLKKEEQILQLKQQLRDLEPALEKYNAIKNIVLDQQLVECLPAASAQPIRAIESVPQEQRQVLSLPGPSDAPLERGEQGSRVVGTNITDIDGEETQDQQDLHQSHHSSHTTTSTQTSNDEVVNAGEEEDDLSDSISTYDAAEAFDRLSDQPLHRISERQEEEEEQHPEERLEVSSGKDQNEYVESDDASQSSTLKSIELSPPEDSLLPPDVTSVPPIDQPPERTIHTPSVYNCLDPSKDSVEEAEKSEITPKLRESNGNTTEPTPASSSPIQPIKRKSNIGNVCSSDQISLHDMYQSTPVLAQKNPLKRMVQLSIVEQSRSTANFERPRTPDQENHINQCADETLTQLTNNQEPQQPHVDLAQPKSKTSKGKKVEGAAKRNLSKTDQVPTRYNLRKRSKV